MKSNTAPDRSSLRRLFTLFGWTRHSTVLLGGFLLVIFLIVYIWWPLAEQVLAYINWGGEWWRYFDWLLVGIFLFMSLTILSGADLRRDALIVFVGALGGLVIESWGTQTNLWFYYTAERPPLWIIPAWPIASLSIDRITRLLVLLTTKNTKEATVKRLFYHRDHRVHGESKNIDSVLSVPALSRAEGFSVVNFNTFYWFIFIGFYALMLYFVTPTFGKTTTLGALLLCALLIATPTDHRAAVLTFLAGSGLGYFLELWGTTRQCWTYYTFQTPPIFAVLAHGMAAVAFWRAGLLLESLFSRLKTVLRLDGIRKPERV